MFRLMIIGRIAGFVVIALVAMLFSAQLASAHGNEDHAAKARPQTTDLGMEYRHLRPAEACASTGDTPILTQYDLRFDNGRCFYTCASPAGVLHETNFSIIPSGRIPSGPVFTRLASQDTAPPRKPPRSGG